MTHVKTAFQHPLFFAPSGPDKTLQSPVYAWGVARSKTYALKITEVRHNPAGDTAYLQASYWTWNKKEERWEGAAERPFFDWKPFESNPSRNPIRLPQWMPCKVNYKEGTISNIRVPTLWLSPHSKADYAPPVLLKYATHVPPLWWGDTWPVIVQYEENLRINLK